MSQAVPTGVLRQGVLGATELHSLCSLHEIPVSVLIKTNFSNLSKYKRFIIIIFIVINTIIIIISIIIIIISFKFTYCNKK